MKKKIFCILFCTLLIITSVPTINSLKNNTLSPLLSDSKPESCSLENWIEIQKLLASDGESGELFGWSVSISGDYAIIGAYADDPGGSAYVFKRSGTNWTEEDKLVASDGAYADQFGWSVSISGDYTVIGAYGDDSLRGAAYVFKRSGTNWLEEDKLFASDGESGDHFGDSVSVSGDYAIIGAYGDDDHGSAYVYKRSGTNWLEEAKLVASDGGSHFGAVSIDGDYAVIGDFAHNSAYVFKRNGTNWTETKLVASDSELGDHFGCSVAICGDYAVIGAEEDDDFGHNSGAAYVFKRNGTNWTEEAKFVASDSEANDRFGVSVSTSGDYAFIGAWNDDIGRGSAYVFKRNGTNWTEEVKLVASDGESFDNFGCSVSIDSDHAIIGAYSDDSLLGSAYIFIKEVENQPPSAPTIDGPVKGFPFISYLFTFNTTDPDGNDVSYYIDWGDGFITNWTTYQPSTSPDYSEGHSWIGFDVFTIKVKAKDTFGLESLWTNYSFSTPRNRAINTLFINFLQNHLNLFLILRHLMKL